MKTSAVAFLCGLLLLSGCTRQEVNKVSLIEYERDDEAEEIALKTAANLIPWVGGALMYMVGAFAYIVSEGGTQRVSGTVSGNGSVSTYK